MMVASRMVATGLLTAAIGALGTPGAMAQQHQQRQMIDAVQSHMGGAGYAMGPHAMGLSGGAVPMIGQGYSGGSGTAGVGGAYQSVLRTDAMMQSMYQNNAAKMRGLSDQVVYRADDILYGVYWQTYYANQARLRSVYAASLVVDPFGRPSPYTQQALGRLNTMAELDNRRRQSQEAARTAEIIRRLDRRHPVLEAEGPGFGPDELQTQFLGSDLLDRQWQDLPPADLTDHGNVTRRPNRR